MSKVLQCIVILKSNFQKPFETKMGIGLWKLAINIPSLDHADERDACDS
jgi:hypothetical protein